MFRNGNAIAVSLNGRVHLLNRCSQRFLIELDLYGFFRTSAYRLLHDGNDLCLFDGSQLCDGE